MSRLFPISWLLSLIMSCYLSYGQADVPPRALHSQMLRSSSTAKMNGSIARPSSQIDSASIRSHRVTAASTKPSHFGSCNQDRIDIGLCQPVVGDIDVYFWPAPSRNTNCLSIVGDASNPPMQDALTSTVYGQFYNNSMYTTVYWGCTARDPNSGESFITTAVLATTGSLSVKQYLFNPWASQPCSAEALPSTSLLSQPLESGGAHISGHVRRHTLLAPSGITQHSGQVAAEVTSGNFTL